MMKYDCSEGQKRGEERGAGLFWVPLGCRSSLKFFLTLNVSDLKTPKRFWCAGDC